MRGLYTEYRYSGDRFVKEGVVEIILRGGLVGLSYFRYVRRVRYVCYVYGRARERGIG